MSTFKERLQEFLKTEGVSKSEFARIIGVSAAYVGSMRKSMPTEKLKRIFEHFPSLNRDWLMYGEGEMYVEEPQPDDYQPMDSKKDRDSMIPVVPCGASAGRFPILSEGVDLSQCEFILSPLKDAEIAIMVDGDSMEPRIHNGTYLLLKKIKSDLFIPWGHPLVIDTENGPLVKVLYEFPDNPSYIQAVSYNQNYPPLHIPKSGIRDIYRIIGTFRKGEPC